MHLKSMIIIAVIFLMCDFRLLLHSRWVMCFAGVLCSIWW